jgi:hypothetical protein
MRRTNFLQIAVALLSIQLLCCKEDPVSQSHSGTRTLFESTTAPVVCDNSGDPVNLISKFVVSRHDSTTHMYTFTNQSSGATYYSMDFGDGSAGFHNSSFTTISHTFAGPGQYVATLIVLAEDKRKCSENRISIDPIRDGG